MPDTPEPAAIVENQAGQTSPAISAQQQLLLEISKSLLTGTLATTRGAMQILQGITGILLASYMALLSGFGKQLHLNLLPALLLASPIFCYVLSLFIGFGQVLFYRGAHITLGDLESGISAYETVVSAQRRQLIFPLLFLLAGVVMMAIVTIKILKMH